jgi:hypothetical protein
VANVYVYSGAAGAGTGADWTNAYTTLTAAFAAKAAGDDFWVAHDHAQTQASTLTLTSPGTVASPCRVMCVSRSGSTPPVSADLATTATVTTTAANVINISGGNTYWYGIIFNCGSGAVSSVITVNDSVNSFEACSLRKLGTSGSTSAIIFGSSASGTASLSALINTTVQFGSTGDGISIRGSPLFWRNTASAILGATLPTILFRAASNQGTTVLVEGVDLSALGSGATFVGAILSPQRFLFKDCKLGASVTVAATPTAQGGAETVLIRCDSGDTNYRTEKYRYEGTQTTETTIVRTGGASDGATPIAWKIITTANSKRYLPFEAMPISIWNETTGSAITLTIQGIWGGGAVPTNADIWMDVEYLGTSGFPIGGFRDERPGRSTRGRHEPLGRLRHMGRFDDQVHAVEANHPTGEGADHGLHQGGACLVHVLYRS